MKLGAVHLSAALAFSAILVAAFAQYSHTFSEADARAIILFVLALLLFAAAVATARVTIDTRDQDGVSEAKSGRQSSTSLQLGILGASLLTFFLSSDNEFNPDNVLAWIVSIAIFLYTFWEPQKRWSEWREWTQARVESARGFILNGFKISRTALLFCSIMFVGIFFYYYNLDGVPAEMTSDHAEKILDVNDVVNHGLRPIFFERNTGREPLEFYLIALFVELGKHPIDHMALKLVTATMGLLVIPGVVFFARELFEEEVAFSAAALVAISKWPLTIARMGLRFPFTPVFVAPLCFFLLRALKYKSRNDFLLAGVILGTGLYGYIAFRMAPVLVFGLIAAWFFFRRKLAPMTTSRYIANTSLLFAMGLIVFMPLLRYSADHPGDFWYRVLTRMAEIERSIPGNPLKTLAGNIVNTGLMFNWIGDTAWPNSIPGDPALDYITGGLFFLGVMFALYRLIKFREFAYLFVLIGLVVMLLPTTLSLAFPVENPSNARAGGAIPFVFIIASLPIVWLIHVLRQAWGNLSAFGVVLLLFLLIARVNYVRYFENFDVSYRAASWNTTEVASVIRGFTESVGDLNHVYIMLWPNWIDSRNVAINVGHIEWDQTIPSADDVASMAEDPANKLFILNPGDHGNLQKLEEIFPNGQFRTFSARTPGHDFILYYVPGTLAPQRPLGVGPGQSR